MDTQDQPDFAFSEDCCPLTQRKVHCGLLEESDAYGLGREKWLEFCSSKCLVYRWQRDNGMMVDLNTDDDLKPDSDSIKDLPDCR